MNDLLKRRQWLLLREAAEYLSAGVGQQVDEAEILRFALDGKLDLSVHLEAPVAAYGNKGQCYKIAGLCEFVLEDSARDEIEHLYRVERHRPTKEIRSFSGAHVKQGDHVCQLPSSAYPPSSLPSGAVLAVKTEVLDEFIRQFREASQRADSRPMDLEKRERETMLILIAVLAKEVGIDIDRPSKAAHCIESLTEIFGARVSRSNHRKQAQGHPRRTRDPPPDLILVRNCDQPFQKHFAIATTSDRSLLQWLSVPR